MGSTEQHDAPLDYERLNAAALARAVRTEPGERLLVRQAYRWFLDGQPVSNAFEAQDLEQVCRDNRLRVVVGYGEHLAVVSPAN